ncbi:MAG: hypothetical protein HONBIEJF_02596 [Fimbriimonadaceae bacterium]|nr:hypothetical protein [Fimbriimonadaceae bacterium]
MIEALGILFWVACQQDGLTLFRQSLVPRALPAMQEIFRQPGVLVDYVDFLPSPDGKYFALEVGRPTRQGVPTPSYIFMFQVQPSRFLSKTEVSTPTFNSEWQQDRTLLFSSSFDRPDVLDIQLDLSGRLERLTKPGKPRKLPPDPPVFAARAASVLRDQGYAPIDSMLTWRGIAPSYFHHRGGQANVTPDGKFFVANVLRKSDPEIPYLVVGEWLFNKWSIKEIGPSKQFRQIFLSKRVFVVRDWQVGADMDHIVYERTTKEPVFHFRARDFVLID